MANRLQLRRDTATNWNAVNPILADGEIGIDTTNKLFKIGNGLDAWNSLSYASAKIDDLASALFTTYSSEKIVALLGGKADSEHTHTLEDVEGLNTALATKADTVTVDAALATKADTVTVDAALATKADGLHTHAITDVTNLQTELARIEQLAMAGL